MDHQHFNARIRRLRLASGIKLISLFLDNAFFACTPCPVSYTHLERKFLDKALEDYRDARKGLDDLAKPSEKAIHPQYLAQQISHFAADDAIFTCDAVSYTHL